RGVLVGGDPRLRGDPAEPLPPAVRMRTHGGLVGAHPRAEAPGPPDPPHGRLRRAYAEAAARRVIDSSRSLNFCGLPVTVIGNASANRTWRGTLKRATRARQNSRTAS